MSANDPKRTSKLIDYPGLFAGHTLLTCIIGVF